MSIEAVGRALAAPLGGNPKVLLLGLANHAHPDGTNSYPSIERLAGYCHCDRRTAQRNVRKLQDDGFIEQEGVGPVGQTRWRICFEAWEGGRQNATPRQNAGGGTHAAGGGGISGPGGAAPMPPEPSIEPSIEPSFVVDRTRTRDDDPADTIGELFAYWQQTCGHPSARPSPERTSKVKARLKDGYTPDQIRTAIDGAARAPFVSPDNGKRFDDLELICRTGAKLEDFIGRATLPAPGDATNVRELRPRTVSELKYLDKREREQRGIDALERVMAAQRQPASNPSDIEGEATEL